MIMAKSVKTDPLRTTIQIQLALWGQPWCWYGPQWNWV